MSKWRCKMFYMRGIQSVVRINTINQILIVRLDRVRSNMAILGSESVISITASCGLLLVFPRCHIH